MSSSSIAARYAKSIIDLAKEQQVLEKVMDDVAAFETALKNRDLFLMIKSPIIKADKKQKVFEALFDQQFHELTNAFLGIIIRKGREPLLPEIVKEVISQYKKLKNITTAALTTAVEVSPETLDSVKTALKSSDRITGEVELATHLDPSILGGFILELEGHVYDASVRDKLSSLKQEILDNSYIKSL